MAATQDGSEIKEFCRGTNIFVTGGTGCLGIVVIEKLLRSCRGIKKIYVLCRSKRDKDANMRLDELFDCTLFDAIRKTNPQFRSKIVLVQGDISQIKLRISEEDQETLVNEIDVILHRAATVRFNEPLSAAVRINIRGTRELLLLARGMKHLKSLVHVSTAYSNFVRHHIEEKLYETPIDGDLLLELVEAVDEETLMKITPGLLGKYPNTYRFSKVITEKMVDKFSEELPVCIVRPSMVISTCKEPLPGWCNNPNGATWVVEMIILGILHTCNTDGSKKLALVPVDFVANTIIAAAWDVVQTRDSSRQKKTRNKSHDTPIYNCTGSAEHALSWDDFLGGSVEWCRTVPTVQCMWSNFVLLNKYKYVDLMCKCLFHFLPAYLVDGFLFLIGKQPNRLKNYERIHRTYETIKHFTLREWKFGNENITNLHYKMNDVDKKLFNVDMSDMSWSECIKNYVTGLRVHLLKDPLSTLPQARRKYMMFAAVNKILPIVLLFALYYVL